MGRKVPSAKKKEAWKPLMTQGHMLQDDEDPGPRDMQVSPPPAGTRSSQIGLHFHPCLWRGVQGGPAWTSLNQLVPAEPRLSLGGTPVTAMSQPLGLCPAVHFSAGFLGLQALPPTRQCPVSVTSGWWPFQRLGWGGGRTCPPPPFL